MGTIGANGNGPKIPIICWRKQMDYWSMVEVHTRDIHLFFFLCVPNVETDCK